MTKFSKIALCALVIGASAFFTSCNKDDDNTTEPALTLYQKLGGTTMKQDPNAAPGVMIEAGRLSYRSVVDSTIVLIVADILTGANGNLSAHFAPIVSEYGTPAFGTNAAILSDNLTDFFSFNTGGTNAVNKYSGLDMVAAHNPGNGAGKNPRMGIKANNASYDKFEGYVGAAANLNGVPTGSPVYNEVVAVLESLRKPIVQDPS